MYRVRKATKEDLFWLVSQAYFFCSEIKLEKTNLFNAEHMVKFLSDLIRKDSILICEKEEVQIGALGILETPHFLNPEVKVFSEMFWWVAEEFRNGRAALLLFNEFVRLGKESGSDVLVISKFNSSGVKDDFFEKKNFTLLEKSFISEV